MPELPFEVIVPPDILIVPKLLFFTTPSLALAVKVPPVISATILFPVDASTLIAFPDVSIVPEDTIILPLELLTFTPLS